MSIRRFHLIIDALLLAAMSLSGCGTGKVTPTPTTAPLPPTPTSTPVPPRQLTICLGQEPTNLFPLGNSSSAARSILAAVYDGPIDINSYGYQAVILTKLPNLADKDAILSAVQVNVGDEVVAADGTPVTLSPGARVRKAGCRSDDCAVIYDGKGEIQMDQMAVTFSMKTGLKWSDGTPLTAEDSVYSYNLTADPKTPGSKYLVDRTKAYEATNATSVQWWGKPGFIDPTYFINFWTPYPRHLWSQIPADQLTDSDISARTPVGWGPYIIQEWKNGDHITLTKNPNYFRAGEGLPKFDFLVFRFTPDPGAAISALLSEACDMLDPGIPLEGQVSLLQSLQSEGKLTAELAQTPVLEQLALGILPSSYDSGYNPDVDRADIFGNKQVRQAIAMCLDRQKVVDTVLYGYSSVPTSYLPAGHPRYSASEATYSFDVAKASQLLDSAGWKDTDNDPSTPRQAVGISGILGGTLLELNYYTTGAAQRQQVSQILAESMAQCGIKVNIRYMASTDLFAPGPGGVLFGRKFDLAEYAMGSTGVDPSCKWFTSSEIPTAANHWVGVNIDGYSNPAFDVACQAGLQSLPDEPAYAAGYRDTQSIFAEDLPAIPLYWRLKVAAARPDFCNFRLDPTASSALWNVEAYDYGSGCGR